MSDSDYSDDSDSSIDSINTDDMSEEDNNPRNVNKAKTNNAHNDKNGKNSKIDSVKNDIKNDQRKLRAIADKLLRDAENGGILHGAVMEYNKREFKIHVSTKKHLEKWLTVRVEKGEYLCLYLIYDNDHDDPDYDPEEAHLNSRDIDTAFIWLQNAYEMYTKTR
jgi:hypothetical protein